MGEHRRFIINTDQIENGVATLDKGIARQITRVLRLKQGDRIYLLDGTGKEHNAEIFHLSNDSVLARIIGTSISDTEPNLFLSLAVCIPKGNKLELIVQKCTELGISEIIPVQSERTIVHLDTRRQAERLERWRKIAAEAAEQCDRSKAPEIKSVINFPKLTAEIGRFDLPLIAWEEECQTSMRDVLREHSDAKSVLMIIGPEGGFSESEVKSVISAGAKCVSLGKRVLRNETAAIAACAAIMYELEGEL